MKHRSTFDRNRIARFAGRKYRCASEAVRVRLTALGGGLESAGVALAHARPACGRGKPFRFVVKRVAGSDCREIDVYRRLLARAAPDVAPRLLGTQRTGAGGAYLYLEWIPAARQWPWSEVDTTARVLERLAQVHESVRTESYPGSLAEWDYEAFLTASAVSTLELFEAVSSGMEGARASLPALRRTVASLAALRRQLVYGGPPAAVLHGDVHTGNAIIRSGRSAGEPVFIDWSRARIGSPLEDVCSWLQSLGYWEPEARRRHDTLLGRYLAARGLRTPPPRYLRDLYWMAGASNAMAGALRWHLFVAGNPEMDDCARFTSAQHVRHWLRIIRRADACRRA